MKEGRRERRNFNVKKKPCDKCPYKLGLIKTLVNPCPQCELDGYKTFETFTKLPGTPKRDDEKRRKNEH